MAEGHSAKEARKKLPEETPQRNSAEKAQDEEEFVVVKRCRKCTDKKEHKKNEGTYIQNKYDPLQEEDEEKNDKVRSEMLWINLSEDESDEENASHWKENPRDEIEDCHIPVISNGAVNLGPDDFLTRPTAVTESTGTRSERMPEAEKSNLGSLGLLQEMHVDSINGCDDKIEEWEEPEFLVDSGASATVVGKDQVRAVKASEPDPNRWYNMADGNIIQNRGEKLFRAETDEYRSLQLRTQVADVDKALLSVAQIVDCGGRVVFSPAGSYIETVSLRGQTRKYHVEFRDGLNVMRLWIPKNQGSGFQGQA